MQNNKEAENSISSSSISYELIPRNQAIQPPKNDQPIYKRSSIIKFNHKNNLHQDNNQKHQDNNQKHQDNNQKHQDNNNQYTIEKLSPQPSTQKAQTIKYLDIKEQTDCLHYQVQESRKIIEQLNQTIDNLNKQILQEREENQLQSKANQIYTDLFRRVKNIFHEEDITIILQQIENNFKNVSEHNKFNEIINHRMQIQIGLRKQLQAKQEQIEELRNQLIKSSQNNIFALLNTSIERPQRSLADQIRKINKQVSELRDSLHQLPVEQDPNTQQLQISNSSCQTIIRIQQIEMGYQNITKDYQAMQNTINILHSQQQQAKHYFDQIKDEIKTILTDQKHKINTQLESRYLIRQMQAKLNYLIESLNVPEVARIEVHDSIQQNLPNSLAFQIRSLHLKIQESELYRQAQLLQKEELEKRIQHLEKEQGSLVEACSRISKLQSKLKTKNKRIVQLENTIIDHMENQSKQQKVQISHESLIHYQNNIQRCRELLCQSRKDNQLLTQQVQEVKDKQNEAKKVIQILFQHLENLKKLRDILNDESVPVKTTKNIINQMIADLTKRLLQMSNRSESEQKNQKKINFHKKNIR